MDSSMTPSEISDLKDCISKQVEKSIGVYVNGKLDKIDAKLDQHIITHTEDTKRIDTHMLETKEIMEAFRGVRAIGEVVKWLSGVGVAIVAAWAILRGNLRL